MHTKCPPQELIDHVMSGEVQTKKVEGPKNRSGDGPWRFLTRCWWDWDTCALSNTSGTRPLFEARDGAMILWLLDLRDLDAVHPNLEKL